MAERDPITKRFVKRDPAPPAAAPDPGPSGPIRLNIRPVDAEPAPPGETPIDAPPLEGDPGAPGEGPGPEAPATAAVLVAALDALVGRALGPEYRAQDAALEEVKGRAAPVIIRAANVVGMGDLAARALPEWADELVKLGASVYLAWGDAIAEAWSRAIAARREEQDAAGGSGAGADGAAGDGARGGGPGFSGPGDFPAAAQARPVAPDGPAGTDASYGDLLATRLAASRGIRPGAR